MPALLTRTSTRPNSSIAASTSAWHDSGSATSVATVSARRPAASTSAAVSREPVDPAGAEHDVGAGLGEGLREGDAEPAGGAGDDGDLAVEAEQVGHQSVAMLGNSSGPASVGP